MRDVVIVAAKRTAVGSFGGGLSSLSADQLGSAVIKALLAETGVAADQVNEVVLGQVLTAGCGQNPARQASIIAGIPASVPAMTINKVCGSGLKSVMFAAQAIRAGDLHIAAAGGMESMTNAPYILPQVRKGVRLGHGKLQDSMVADGLWDVSNDFHMGITGELVAEKYDVTREAQDTFAAQSHEKAVAAIQAGRFGEEIVDIEIPQRKGEPRIFILSNCPII